ncbi:hypothetical protein [Acinetobacter variabilis]|uniref:hypothetical protein n=1 Tax=Acinetobacter variabilis TaxID=70346 RepID=UPI0030F9464F
MLQLQQQTAAEVSNPVEPATVAPVTAPVAVVAAVNPITPAVETPVTAAAPAITPKAAPPVAATAVTVAIVVNDNFLKIKLVTSKLIRTRSDKFQILDCDKMSLYYLKVYNV